MVYDLGGLKAISTGQLWGKSGKIWKNLKCSFVSLKKERYVYFEGSVFT